MLVVLFLVKMSISLIGLGLGFGPLFPLLGQLQTFSEQKRFNEVTRTIIILAGAGVLASMAAGITLAGIFLGEALAS